ncbi:MAG: EamA family transporter, partial [Sediminispirochaetaceae bacterium]
LIVGSTLIAFLAYNYAITCIHVSKAAVFLNGVPVVAVILSAFVLKEGLGVLQVIGGVIVIAGVTLTNLRRRTRSVPDRRIVS